MTDGLPGGERADRCLRQIEGGERVATVEKIKPAGVIKIKQTMPMRSDLHEYFLKDFKIDLKVWKDT